jgi:hypothetical protein
MRRAILVAAAAVLVPPLALVALRGYSAETGPADPTAEKAEAAAEEEDESEDFIDPLGPNAACYVCHTTFIHEEMSKVHKAEKTGCIDCHGLSAGHANDENVGATPPDIVYRRDEVDASCLKCHETHDAPAAQVIARFLERKLAPAEAAICTDCHGQHRIEKAAEGVSSSGAPATSNAVSRRS